VSKRFQCKPHVKYGAVLLFTGMANPPIKRGLSIGGFPLLRLCSPLRPKQRGFAGQAAQGSLKTSSPYVWRTSFAGMILSNKTDFCFLIKSGFPFDYK